MSQDTIKYFEPNSLEYKYEDLNIGIALKVHYMSRSLIGGAEFSGSVNILYGDGTEKFLTTSYSDITIMELKGGGDKESIGIESISINYNSWYFPEVNIKFVDVRGNSVFNSMELTNNKADKQEAKGSFLKAFFMFPYPMFILTVKGYFGKPVTYNLTVKDVPKAMFNSKTGNFEMSVNFIGHMYYYLTDIPMSLLLAAPYIKYNGNDENLGIIKSGEYAGSQIPSFVDFIKATSDALPGINQNPEIENERKKFSNNKFLLDLAFNIKDTFEEISNILNDFCQVESNESVEADTVLISVLENTLTEGKTPEGIYKSITEKVSNIKTNSRELWGDENILIISKNNSFSEDEKKKFYFNSAADISTINNKINSLNQEQSNITKKIETLKKKVFETSYNFLPTLKNMVEITVAHLKKLQDNTQTLMSNINNESAKRKSDKIKCLTDCKNLPSSFTYPPFTGFLNSKNEYIWIGQTQANTFSETTFITHVINGIENFNNKATEALNSFEKNLILSYNFPLYGIYGLYTDIEKGNEYLIEMNNAGGVDSYCGVKSETELPKVFSLFAKRYLYALVFMGDEYANTVLPVIDAYLLLSCGFNETIYSDTNLWGTEAAQKYRSQFETLVKNELEKLKTANNVELESYSTSSQNAVNCKGVTLAYKHSDTRQYGKLKIANGYELEMFVTNKIIWTSTQSSVASSACSDTKGQSSVYTYLTNKFITLPSNYSVIINEMKSFLADKSVNIESIDEAFINGYRSDIQMVCSVKDEVSMTKIKNAINDTDDIFFGVFCENCFSEAASLYDRTVFETGGCVTLSKIGLLLYGYNLKYKKINKFEVTGDAIEIITYEGNNAEIDKFYESEHCKNIIKIYDENIGDAVIDIKKIVNEHTEGELMGNNMKNAIKALCNVPYNIIVPHNIKKATNINKRKYTYIEGEKISFDSISIGNLTTVVDKFVQTVRQYVDSKNVTNKDTATYETPEEIIANNDKKLATYDIFKHLYDRWKFGAEEFDETMIGDIDIENFIFRNSLNVDISDKLVVNIEKIVHLISSIYKGETNMSVYQFLFEICSYSDCLLLALPSNVFEMTNTNKKLQDMFTPFQYSSVINNNNAPLFVVTYRQKDSQHLNFSSNDVTYDDDGVDFTNPNCLSTYDAENIGVFGVTYGLSSQSFFKDVQVSMDKPKVTEQSLASTMYIAENGSKSGSNKFGITYHDIFDTYSNHSYQCTIETMGNMQIMPMMYFQLNNIPLFKGGYFITSVQHTINNKGMTTTFNGNRINRKQLLLSKPTIFNYNDDDGIIFQDGDSEPQSTLIRDRVEGLTYSKENTIIVIEAGHYMNYGSGPSKESPILSDDDFPTTEYVEATTNYKGNARQANGILRPLNYYGEMTKMYREYWGNRKMAKALFTELNKKGYHVTIKYTDIRISSTIQYTIPYDSPLMDNKTYIIVNIHSNAAGDGGWNLGNRWEIYKQNPKGETVENDTKTKQPTKVYPMYPEISEELAKCIAEKMYNKFEILKTQNKSIKVNGNDVAIHTTPKVFERSSEGYRGMTYSSAPAVLSENLFHDTKEHVKFLAKKENRDVIVQAHVEGIELFFEKMKGKTT